MHSGWPNQSLGHRGSDRMYMEASQFDEARKLMRPNIVDIKVRKKNKKEAVL
jgi:hypothetical protein